MSCGTLDVTLAGSLCSPLIITRWDLSVWKCFSHASDTILLQFAIKMLIGDYVEKL